MSPKPLTNTLKVHRAMRNWTQAELAARTGVTRKTINTIETGRYAPSVFVALRIARAFDLPVEKLFQLDEAQAPKT